MSLVLGAPRWRRIRSRISAPAGARAPPASTTSSNSRSAPHTCLYRPYTRPNTAEVCTEKVGVGGHRGCTKSGVSPRVHRVRGSTEATPSQGFSLRVHQVRSSTEGAQSQGFHQGCTESGVLLRLHQVRGSHWGCTKSGVLLRVHQVRGSTKSAPSQGFYWGYTKSGVLTEGAPSQEFYWGCTKSGVPPRVHRVRGSTEATPSQGFHWGCAKSGVLLREGPLECTGKMGSFRVHQGSSKGWYFFVVNYRSKRVTIWNPLCASHPSLYVLLLWINCPVFLSLGPIRASCTNVTLVLWVSCFRSFIRFFIITGTVFLLQKIKDFW